MVMANIVANLLVFVRRVIRQLILVVFLMSRHLRELTSLFQKVNLIQAPPFGTFRTMVLKQDPSMSAGPQPRMQDLMLFNGTDSNPLGILGKRLYRVLKTLL